MNNMVNKAQGFGLSILTKIAGSEVLDQLKLRKFVEKSLYQSFHLLRPPLFFLFRSVNGTNFLLDGLQFYKREIAN